MTQPTCETCRFWGSDYDYGKNICQRFPPVVTPGSLRGSTAKYPLTRDTWWCGEHQPAQQKEGER